jgi:hypothetical protein
VFLPISFLFIISIQIPGLLYADGLFFGPISVQGLKKVLNSVTVLSLRRQTKEMNQAVPGGKQA